MLTLKLFESQINVIKRCYFNPKRKKKKKSPTTTTKNKKHKTKQIHKQTKSKQNIIECAFKIYRHIKYFLSFCFTAWSQINNGTISKNTLLCLVIFHVVFDYP